MFHYLLTAWNQTQLIHSVANKTSGGKKKKKHTHTKTQDAKYIKWEQLWLRQLRWRELARILTSIPLTLSPEGVHWEKQGSLWVLSDTAALENYAGYIVSCSTWEAKFTHLFNEITTHHIKSVICMMKWLVVQRQQFHSTVKHWQFQGDEGIAICSEEGDPTVRMDPNSGKGAHQWPNSCFVSTKTGGSVLKGSNKGTPKHLEMGKIGYTPATDPVLITLWTLEFTH